MVLMACVAITTLAPMTTPKKASSDKSTVRPLWSRLRPQGRPFHGRVLFRKVARNVSSASDEVIRRHRSLAGRGVGGAECELRRAVDLQCRGGGDENPNLAALV